MSARSRGERCAVLRRALLQIIGAWSLALAMATAAFQFAVLLYGPVQDYVPYLLLALPCMVLLLVVLVFAIEWNALGNVLPRPDDSGMWWVAHVERQPARPDPRRRTPLRLGFWGATCAVADTVALHLSASWSRGVTLELGALWLCTAFTAAWLLAYGFNALSRRAPLARRQVHPPNTPLRDRFLLTTLGCGLQVVLMPLLALSLWLDAPRTGIDDARSTAESIVAHVEAQDWEVLGRDLARRPDVAVRLGDRTLGNAELHVPTDVDGPFDRERDGRIDLVVRNLGDSVIAVAVRPPPRQVLALGFGLGLIALAGFGVIATRFATTLQRDITAASERSAQLGHDAPVRPVPPAPPRILEVHELMQRVGHLLSSASEATVASYVAIERVKEAERLKSQFLANMSHDLRSPLNSILGFSELLLSGIEGPITPEQRDMIEPIHRSGRALLEQIDDILDTAKIEAGKLALHEEATPVAMLLGRAIHTARQRRGSQIEYPIDVAPGLPPAWVDPHRTVQALVNVLLFAGSRLERGSVSIRVRLGASGKGRTVFIEVHTPVRPATADELAKLRRGFYRVPGHRGLGLMLPLAAAFLELQGGGLGIEDLGSAMTFTLHLQAPAMRANLAVVER